DKHHQKNRESAGMVACSSEEAPLGFSGDVDLRASFKLTGEATTTSSSSSAPAPAALPGAAASSGTASQSPSHIGFSAPVLVERLPPPSLQDEGLIGGGVVLTGAG
ncbi:unnamed protein product, partial [Laminaria digitata]